MRVDFDEFVVRVREPLSVLDVEPAFQHRRGEYARFIQEPHRAELHPVSGSQVRLSFLLHGALVRTVELPLTTDAVWLAWTGIVAVFESR
jgi:hypothetical protein